MCIAPRAPAPVVQRSDPLPDPNDAERERAAKDAQIAANRRRGFGNTNVSRTGLGSSAQGRMQRPTLLGQGVATA